MASKPIVYLQTDPRWAKNSYSAPGEAATIQGSGCGPTAAAMVIATLKDSSVTPETTCAWSARHGGKCPHNGTYYSYFARQGAVYGLSWRQLNSSDLRSMPASSAKQYHDMAERAVADGDMVICCMGPGQWTHGGHFILWYATDPVDGVLYVNINDPASMRPERLRNKLSLLQSQVKYYFQCHKPAEEENEETDMTENQVRGIVAGALQQYKESNWYCTVEDVPECYRPVIQRLINAGALRGYGTATAGTDETDANRVIRVDETFCRIFTILERLSALGTASQSKYAPKKAEDR